MSVPADFKDRNAKDHNTVDLSEVLAQKRTLHFVGIGGIGMSGLAKILLGLGYPVSGSDLKENALLHTLREQGAVIHIGHHADHVPAQAALVVSTAIDRHNPEIAQARQFGLPIFHRSELLREIFQGKAIGHSLPIGLSGTHGKTTMTGMTGLILRAAGLDPTIIAGGRIPGLETNAVLGASRRIAVAELDESDGSIVQYTPAITVIANLELDHAEHYPNGLAGILEAFLTFLNALAPDSQVLFNMLCPNVAQLAAQAPSHIRKILVFPGENPDNRIPMENTYELRKIRIRGQGCYQGYVYCNGRLLGEISPVVPGRHNLTNALFAIAVGHLLEADFEVISQALSEFTGIGRRFERLGRFQGAELVDDYAHHPTEVLATLKAAREVLGVSRPDGGRLIAIFQPHRFTRLQALWTEFLTCFNQADKLYITDVYPAAELPIPGVDAEQFAAALEKTDGHPPVTLYRSRDWEAFRKLLQSDIQPRDMVISMGAGDITTLLRGFSL